MSDQRFERDLTDVVQVLSGDDASAALRDRLAEVPKRPAAAGLPRTILDWRLAVTVAAAIALVAVAILFAPGLLRPGPASSPNSPPASVPIASRWTGLDWSAPISLSASTRIRDIVAWRGRWIGVGVYQQPDAEFGEPTFLSSPDGLHWRIAYRDNAHINQFPAYIVPIGSGLLTVSDQGVLAGGCCSAPSLWHSDDGQAWYGVTPQGDWNNVWHTNVRLLDVAGGPNGVVAIGVGTDATPVIVHSTDGRTWSRVNLPPSFAHAVLRDVTAFRDGFVVVGRDGQPDVRGPSGAFTYGVGKPAAWVSADGATWNAAEVDGTAVAGGELNRVAAGANGLYAVGDDVPAPAERAESGTWVSADGTSWRRTTSASGSVIEGLAGDGERIVRLMPDPNRILIWTASVSTDGVTWAQLAFSGATHLLPLGGLPSGGDRLGSLWVGPNGVFVNGRFTGALRYGSATTARVSHSAPSATVSR